MYLDITPCQTPEPALFEALLLHKLEHSTGSNPAPHCISRNGAACCFIIQRIAETHLVAAHPSSGEKALVSALQCLQQQNLSADTRVVLLSATPPPALAWLSQHHALNWHRCQMVQVNSDYGLLIDDTNSPLFRLNPTSAPAPAPARIQRTAPAVVDTDAPPLTVEEQQFFSHL